MRAGRSLAALAALGADTTIDLAASAEQVAAELAGKAANASVVLVVLTP
jgi:hypothetical protein